MSETPGQSDHEHEELWKSGHQPGMPDKWAPPERAYDAGEQVRVVDAKGVTQYCIVMSYLYERGNWMYKLKLAKPWVSRLFSKTWKAAKECESSERKDEYTTITRSLDEAPEGYSKVATFQSSDRSFLQYRGFAYLHCRVLSGLQNGIERLEQNLDELDKWDVAHGGARKLKNQDKDESLSSKDLAAGFYERHVKQTRPEILVELKAKLLEYDELLLKTKEISSLRRPATRDSESVRTWFRDQEPIVRREAQFIRHKEDIVTLRTGRESAGFDSAVEKCLSRLDHHLYRWCGSRIIQRLFLTPELRAKCLNGDVDYYAPARIDSLVNVCITLVIFALLILPVIILYEVTNIGQRQSALDAIGVLIVFTLVFGMAISALTTAQRHELFAASAAYCAVLVVFLGNFGVQQVQILP
ncbi:hypothetical protein LTR08_008915 [Meristemomyces frigidus]|nr:hypothetical protein LTR08_008915 [Meristemomyces frigidus]